MARPEEQNWYVPNPIVASASAKWYAESLYLLMLKSFVWQIEKDVHRTDRNIPLFAGEDIPHPEPDSPFAEVGTNVHMEQMKDMLLTYNEYNKGLGYVQGMSDLLAPIYAVMQDDAMAFWAFVGFMDRMVSLANQTIFIILLIYNFFFYRNETSSATNPACVLNLSRWTISFS